MKILLMLLSYALGAIPTGYWLGWAWKGVDVRKQGSGNLGATNVLRVLGKGPAAVTFILDAVKGLAPVLLSIHIFPGDPRLALIVGVLAIVGHVTSPFVGFRGGKGVATSFGVFCALMPGPTAMALTAFVVTLALSRLVSLGSIVAAIVLAAGAFAAHASYALKTAATLIAAFVIWAHRANIERLRAGTERRI